MVLSGGVSCILPALKSVKHLVVEWAKSLLAIACIALLCWLV